VVLLSSAAEASLVIALSFAETPNVFKELEQGVRWRCVLHIQLQSVIWYSGSLIINSTYLKCGVVTKIVRGNSNY
jgi:hypothetical protein